MDLFMTDARHVRKSALKPPKPQKPKLFYSQILSNTVGQQWLVCHANDH